MRIQLETKRLILRNLTPDDYQAVFLWCGDPDVARYMVYPVYTKAEDVKAWIETLNPDDPDEYEAGIVLKETGELIGSGGIYYQPEADLWNIGYNLRKDQWGHGYAVEMIRGILEMVHGQRDDSTLIEVCDEHLLFLGDAACRTFPDQRKNPELCDKLSQAIQSSSADACFEGHWTPLSKAETVSDLLADCK